MAVLVMDTATHVLTAAVGTETERMGSTSLLVPRGHSRLLQPTLANLLQSAGVSAADLTLIGVGVGPGSYTGVRMAVSTAKAMATALCIPLVPISTLATLAAAAVPTHVRDSKVVCPLLYARRGRAFGAIYVKSGNHWLCAEEAQVLTVTAWMDKLSRYVANDMGTGAGSAPSMHASGATAGVYPPKAPVIVHDFVESYGVLESVMEFPNADVASISEVSANMGPGLFQLTLQNRDIALYGAEVHGIVPDYALKVEAEAKLSEGGGAT